MTNPTRRNFLTAGAAAAAMPFFIKADDKTGKKLPILGEGEHKYECIHDWGELPSNIKYGNTHSISEDAQGHIYVHHTVHKDSMSPDSVVVFYENERGGRICEYLRLDDAGKIRQGSANHLVR